MIKTKNYICKKIDAKEYMNHLRIYKKIIKKRKHYNYYKLFYDIIQINKN